MAKERRKLQIHPQMILHTIERQAGTLAKAIAEYVMNSIDAKASRIDVTLDSVSFCVKDDGKGFNLKDEIEGMFEVLGFPHDENDDRTFGEFGIGRAQAWAFGSTVWRSGPFTMDVDIAQNGLEYDLEDSSESVEGCEIIGKLYEALMPSEVQSVLRELSELIRYVPVPVFINGDKASLEPENEKWDIVTDDAYINLEPGRELQVYNQGVLVCAYGGWRFGSGGTVVSRGRLTLNTARNDILVAKCDAWKRISKHLKSTVAENTTKKKSLTDDERRQLLGQMIDGELHYNDLKHKNLLRDCRGKVVPLKNVVGSLSSKHYPPLTFEPRDSKARFKADMVVQHKLALVLRRDMQEWLGAVNEQDFCKRLEEAVNRPYANGYQHDRTLDRLVDFEDVAEGISVEHEILDRKTLSARDEAARKAIGEVSDLVRTAVEAVDPEFPRAYRRVELGRSGAALGWTDGQSYIAIEQRLARRLNEGILGAKAVMHTLLHEACHDQPALESHSHDLAFYERFHDADQTWQVGKAIRWLVKAYCREIKKAGIKPNKQILATVDHDTGMIAHNESLPQGVTAENDTLAPAVAAVPNRAPRQPRRRNTQTGVSPTLDLFESA